MIYNFNISVNERIKRILPNARLGILTCRVKILPNHEMLSKELVKHLSTLKTKLVNHRESQWPIIEQTRKAYKLCGKEPSRYRPSSEALLRRIRTGKDLYRVNNVVDTINLLSMTSGFSIGGFDISKINGDIILDIGDLSTYDTIGRGVLNIEYMPGIRDGISFFGTPTSDSTRTMVTDDIDDLMLIYYDFMGSTELENALNDATSHLIQSCDAEQITISLVE